MASASIQNKCSICNKETSTFICSGCSKEFGFDHLTEHRQVLNTQLHEIQNDYNEFRQILIDQKNNTEKRPLIEEINQWENDSIEKIKQTAKECREILIYYTNKIINEIKITLDDPEQQPISIEGKNKDFNEIHLKQFNEKLNKLKEKLNQPKHLSIKQESTSLINKIFVKLENQSCIICKRNFNDLSSTGLCSECDYKKKPSPITRTVVIKQSSPTNISPSTNLVDFEQKTDQIRPCIVCKRYFEDLSLTGLCSDCNYQENPSTTRHVTIRRAPVTNSYSNSDFLKPHSSSLKIRGPLKIVCPNCRVLNVINAVQYGSNYTCLVCKRVLSVWHY